MKNKLKSIFLSVLAVLFIGIGYLNFNTNQDSFDIAYENNSEKTGDVELVNSEPVKSDEEEENSVNELVNETSNNVKTDDINDYFSESRLERDKMYSQLLETYQKMIDSSEMATDQKGIAIEEIDKIATQKNSIFITENLIKNKGFEDVVIFINDKSISVVIKSNISLSKEQIAQIQNIVSRELNSKVENINITNK